LSVLKNLDINLPQSEKKTLYRFLGLYIFFTLVILALTTTLYYNLQKELYNQQKTITLNQYANDFLVQLKELKSMDNYPKDGNFDTSLYDSNYNLIYSTLKNPKMQLADIDYNSNVIVRYIKDPYESFLNTQYLIVTIKEIKGWKNKLINEIIIYGGVFFIFMVIIGYFLLNLFLKPLKDMLHLLNRFIKDTTHELNTPVSTIRTNIEMLDHHNLEDEKLKKIINRIDIGARTISNIYDDLTYLILNHKIKSHNEKTSLQEIIKERIEYFKILADAKKITFKLHLYQDTILVIDRIKLSKLIDNIISNAIKYNKLKGDITITLEAHILTIQDSGKGIEKEHLHELFDRYSRFDTAVGGFGIGLNIVKMICDEYHIDIQFESKIKEYTKVTLQFPQ
jgi:two-component system, OmpR family, sensor kinase